MRGVLSDGTGIPPLHHDEAPQPALLTGNLRAGSRAQVASTLRNLREPLQP